jgi:adenosylmethionine-8-amino-7-oxononanoate aminotransferase
VTRVFHRNPREVYRVAVRGEGAYLVDRDGRRYLDASGGAAVSCLGHSDRAVIEAIQRQLERLPFAHTSFFTNEPMEALAEALVARSNGAFGRVYFVSGGSEALEAALKLARQYFVERGESQRRHVIARRQSYHGNTLGALAVGGNQWRRRQFEPLLIEASHVSPCYAYRERPGACRGVAEVGVAVLEEAAPGHDRVVDRLRHHHRAHGLVARAEPLGDRREVRDDAFLLERPERAAAPHAAHHLVQD